MKKVLIMKTLMGIGLVMLFQFTQAQSFSLSWSEKMKMRYDFDDAVQLANGNTIVLKLEYRVRLGSGTTVKPTLVLADANMETVRERELEVDGNETHVKGFEKYGNNVFFIYEAYNRKDKTTSAYALKIDESTLAISSRIVLGTYESDNLRDQADISLKLSQDSSKVMLFVEGPERRKENKKFYIGVFDTDLKKIWNKDIELPILEKFVSLYDEDVSNDGKVFVAIKHYDKDVTRQTVREDGDKVPSYTYKMLVYSRDAKEKEITFDLNKNFIEGTKLIYNTDGNVTVAGLYKHKHNGNINGIFYTTMGVATNEVKNPKIVEFTEDIIRLVDKDKFGSDKSSDPGLYSRFRINHILLRENGSVDLISEYYRLDIRTYSDGRGRMTTTYNYTYGDIVNTNIDKDGKVVFTRVPKNQKYTTSDIFLGYFPLIQKDKLVLLFNDDKDNVERDLEKAPDDVMKFHKSALVAATIDAKGVLSRQAIYDNDDEDYITIPRNTTKVSEGKYLIVSDLIKTFKRRTRYGILTVK